MNKKNQELLPPIQDLLLHSGDMVMLERILSVDDEQTLAECIPQAGAWYADHAGNMPAWIGIELMAQAIAAHVGLLKRRQNLPPKQGVLLGTRSYKAQVAAFAANQVLHIKVALAYRDDSGLGAYDCSISNNTGELVNATLKVFEPDDFQSFLQGNPA
ncbi:hotdog family protein [Methylobacillus caricis]|uniref:hotdog family protein n=1 Tax=Methylobacillus caricis TaxID=1971611 RepID=UPI001CFF7AC5|nr:hotdog family protein [Methylobacillus caricis]MCB5188046.1 hotdog family protein [Methylobacillus caricis]